MELRSRALPSAEDQNVVPKEQDKEESPETQSQGKENWIVVSKTGHNSVSTRSDNSVIRPCATGPQFFPSTGANQAASMNAPRAMMILLCLAPTTLTTTMHYQGRFN